MECTECNNKGSGGICSIDTTDAITMAGCPCKKCLVKMLCNDPCEIYVTHVADTYAWAQEENYAM